MRLLKKFCVFLIIICFMRIPVIAQEEKYNGYIVKYKGMEEIVLDSMPYSLFSSQNDIEYIIPNVYFNLYDTVPAHNDYDSLSGWDSYINYDVIWEKGYYGQGVKVGVIDSGVYKHEDLSGSILEGYNFKTGTTDTVDTLGHGTFISGIIAANWNERGINGIAKDAKIVPLKCFNTKDDGDLRDICAALRAAVDIYDCDVINLSFGIAKEKLQFYIDGGITALEYLENAVNYALSKGAILVAAVGNDGNDTINYPAAIEGVIGVGSVSKNDDTEADIDRTWMSNYNESVFVVAPGENVTSLGIDNETVTGTGTSYSTPAVTAVAALALCKKEGLNHDSFAAVLKDSCMDIGQPGYDTYYGYGIIDCEKLMHQLDKTGFYFTDSENCEEGYIETFIVNFKGEDINTKAFSYEKNGNALKDIKVFGLNLKNGEGKKIKVPKTDEGSGVLAFWDNLLNPIESRKR